MFGNTCPFFCVYLEEGIFQPCLRLVSEPIKGVQIKMEDTVPQARRAQSRGQVASSIMTVG